MGASGSLLFAASVGLLGMGLSDVKSGITGRFKDDGDETDDSTNDDVFDVDGDFDDEFGGGDGWDEEAFDDFGGDGSPASDVEPRLDEIENEVASISSTIGTVRSENEAISGTVEDIEDNVRKLLEIYEMVTRGVNPFVDEVSGAGGTGDSFGLFDGADDEDEDLADLDPAVADADAESFFDDDWSDDELADDDDFDDSDFDHDGADAERPDESFSGVDDAGAGEVGADEAGADDGISPADASTDEGEGEEGKTFDELKSEYESGDAGWAGEETDAGEEADAGEVAESSEKVDSSEKADSGVATDRHEEPIEDVDAPGADRAGSDGAAGSSAREDGKPYLAELPDGYGADLLVIEWLSYLRSCSSTAETLRAIRYYETIGWVGEAAAESLKRFLAGLSEGETTPAPGGRPQLTVDHHTDSLRYVGRLGGADVQVERLDWTGPTRRGAGKEGKQRGIQR